MVDVSLLRDGRFPQLPKRYPFFQGSDMEGQLKEQRLDEPIECLRNVNPKLYELQKLTGDL